MSELVKCLQFGNMNLESLVEYQYTSTVYWIYSKFYVVEIQNFTCMQMWIQYSKFRISELKVWSYWIYLYMLNFLYM